MLYEKWPIKISFWRGCNFVQSIFTTQYQEMHSQKVTNLDIIGHFWKSTKTPFISKAYNLSMEYQNAMRPKGLVRGHRKVSKKSKNTSKISKLKKLCLVEVGHFSKIAKSQLSSKLQILSKGPTFFHLIWSYNTTHVLYLQSHVHLLIFLFYLIFYWINSF